MAIVPEAPKGARRRVSLIVVRLEKGGEGDPQLLCCEGREATWMIGGEILAGPDGSEGCLAKARSWLKELVVGWSEPFQHSRDVGRDRTDVVCFVTGETAVREELQATYVWKSLGEVGNGRVFLLAANAVGLGLTFMSRLEKARGQNGSVEGKGKGEAERWGRAQERMLTAAQESGKLKAKLVDKGLDLGRQAGSWEDLRERDALARAGLREAIARASQTLVAQEKLALAEWGDKIVPTDALDLRT